MQHRFSTLCFALLLCAPHAHAQTLAHPGWRGNGMVPDAWWKHAVMARMNPGTTFATAMEALEILSQAGVDSIILPDLQTPFAPATQATAPAEVAPAQPETSEKPYLAAFGSADELDAFLREASARRVHVLLQADLLRLAGNPGELRFWLSRGIAGFDVGDVPPSQRDTLHLLHVAMARFPGRRIVLDRIAATPAATRPTSDAITFHLLTPQAAAAVPAQQVAVELQDAGALQQPVPRNMPVVIDGSLLASESLRVDVREAMARRGSLSRPHPAVGGSARSRSR